MTQINVYICSGRRADHKAVGVFASYKGRRSCLGGFTHTGLRAHGVAATTPRQCLRMHAVAACDDVEISCGGTVRLTLHFGLWARRRAHAVSFTCGDTLRSLNCLHYMHMPRGTTQGRHKLHFRLCELEHCGASTSFLMNCISRHVATSCRHD